MASWKAEVNVSSVSFTPTANNQPPSPGFGGQEYWLAGKDIASNLFPVILISTYWDSGSSAWVTQEDHGFGIASGNFQISTINATFSGAGSVFTTGGVISITKNETLNRYEYQGLLGSSNLAFGSAPSLVTVGELAPNEIGIQAGTTPGTDGPTVLIVRFKEFYGRKNGTIIKGADLGSTDRGSWVSTASTLDPWVRLPIADTAFVVITDSPSAAETGAEMDVSQSAFAFEGGVVWRDWQQSVYFGGVGAAFVDMTRASEHGIIYATYVYDSDVTTVKYRRTHDNGTNWTEGDIYSLGSATNSSPNINWRTGRLYAVWWDGAQILQSHSDDYGASWSTPVTIAITGTNPRHIVDPHSGLFYYFAVDSGSLKVARSGDGGSTFIDAAPITIATLSTAQTVDADFTADGAIIVGFIEAGVWTQFKSRDRGMSWS